MNTGKYLLRTGLALLIIGIAAVSFSQLIIEDLLEMERTFGEEPLSIRISRYGLFTAIFGIALMILGGVINFRRRRNEGLKDRGQENGNSLG